MPTSARTVLRRASRSYVVFVALGLLVGLVVAPPAVETTGSEATIAVVPISGTIDGSSTAQVSASLERARQDPNVKAVVLVVNSGGGAASASEELYLETRRTAEAVPVVASIDAGAASGAYFAIAPIDRIVTKPSSVVGSVGVLAPAPQQVEPNDIVVASGPDKLAGAGDREFRYVVETVANAFYNAVERSRGDRLDLSRSELAQARVYAGSQAVENGLADRIGDRRTAVQIAAEEADVDRYDVEVFRPDGTRRFVSRANYLGADAAPDRKRLVGSSYLVRGADAGPTVLAVPGSYVAGALDDRGVVRSNETATPAGPGTPAPAPGAGGVS